MAVIDKISIAITASAEQAQEAIDKLSTSLSKLKSVTGDAVSALSDLAAPAGGIKGFCGAMQSLNTLSAGIKFDGAGMSALAKAAAAASIDLASGQFSSVDAAGIKAFSEALKSLNALGSKLEGDGAGMTTLAQSAADACTKLSGATIDAAGIEGIKSVAETLGEAKSGFDKASAISETLPKLAEAYASAANTLNAVSPATFDPLSDMLYSLTRALKEIGDVKDLSAGTKAIKSLFSALNTLKSFKGDTSNIENIPVILRQISNLSSDLERKDFTESANQIKIMAEALKSFKGFSGGGKGLSALANSIQSIIDLFSQDLPAQDKIRQLKQIISALNGLHIHTTMSADEAKGLSAMLRAIVNISTKLNSVSSVNTGAIRQLGSAFQGMMDQIASTDVSKAEEKIQALYAAAMIVKELRDAKVLETSSGNGKHGANLGGGVSYTFETFTEKVKFAVSRSLELMKQLATGTKELSVGIGQTMLGLGNSIVGVVKGIAAGVSKAFPAFAEKVKTAAQAVGAAMLAPFAALWSKLPTGVQNVLQNVAGKIAAFAAYVKEVGFKKAVSDVFNGVKAIVGQGLEQVKGTIQAKVPGLYEAFEKIGSGVKRVFSGIRTALGGAGKVIGAAVDVLAVAFKAIGPVLKPLLSMVKSAMNALLKAVTASMRAIGSVISTAFTVPLRVMGAAVRTAFSGIAAYVSTLGPQLSAAMKTIAGAFKLGVSGVKAFGRGLKSAYKLFDTLRSKISLANTAVGSLIKKLANRAWSMAMRAIIKQISSAFSEGLEKLYKSESEAKKTLNGLATSLSGLKAAAGSVLYSLLNTLSGVLTQIISMFTTAMNAVSSFFAALGGASTYFKGVTKQTDAYTDSTKKSTGATNSSTKANKKLAKTLMGFDEINQLKEKETSGSSKTDSTASVGKFVKTKISQELLAAIKNRDFTEFAKKLGEKITKALKGVKWNDIYKKVFGYAKMATSFINGLFDGLDAGTVGEAVGKALELVVETINKLWYDTDWSKIGGWVMDMLSSAIENVKGKELGKFLVRKIQAAIKFLRAAMKKWNWKKVGNFMADIVEGMKEGLGDVDGFVDELSQFIYDGIDAINPKWIADTLGGVLVSAVGMLTKIFSANNIRLLGTKLLQFIKYSLNYVTSSITTIASTAMNIGSALIGILQDALGEIDWAKTASGVGDFSGAIIDWMNGEIAGLNADTLGNAVAGLANTLFAALNKLWYELDWEGLGVKLAGFLKSAIKAIDTHQVSLWIVGVLKAGIKLVKGFAKSFDVTAILDTMKTVFIDAAAALKESSEDLGEITDSLIGILGNAFGWLTEKIDGISSEDIGKVTGVIGTVLTKGAEALTSADIPGFVSAVFGLIGKAFEDGSDDENKLESGFKTLTTTLGSELAKIIDAIPVDDAVDAMSGVIGGILAGIKAFATSENIEAFTNKVIAFIKIAAAKFPKILGDIASIAKNIIKGIVSSLENNKNATDIKDSISTVLKSIITNAVKLLPDILAGIKDIALAIIQGLSDAIETFKEDPELKKDLSDAIEAAIEGLGEIAAKIPKLTLDISELILNAAKTTLQNLGIIPGSSGLPDTYYVTDGDGNTVLVSTNPDTGETTETEAKDPMSYGLFDYIGMILGGDAKGEEAIDNVGKFAVAADRATGSVTSLGNAVKNESNWNTGYIDRARGAVDNLGASSNSSAGFVTDLIGKFMNGSNWRTSGVTGTKNAVTDMGNSAVLTKGKLQTVIEKIEWFKTHGDVSGNVKLLDNSYVERCKATLDTFAEHVNGLDPEVSITFTGAMTSKLRSIANMVGNLMAKGYLKGSSVTGSVPSWIANPLGYATGGYPDAGNLFIANERGAEMVGTIGGKTAVANQQEIGDAIFKYMDKYGSGSSGINEQTLAAAIVSGCRSAGIGAVYLDGKQLAQSINRETRRSGKAAIK